MTSCIQCQAQQPLEVLSHTLTPHYFPSLCLTQTEMWLFLTQCNIASMFNHSLL